MSKQDTLVILGNGSHWDGLLEFEGSARIDSDFHGDIRTSGQLVIGPDAEVHGTLTVGELDVFGRVLGDIVAKRKLVLRRGSEVQGNLYVEKLESEDGSRFNGRITMSPERVQRPRRDLVTGSAESLPDSGPSAWIKHA